MILDVHVSSRRIARLYRERDEYVLHYLPGTAPEDFVSLAMPVREAPWRDVAKHMVHAWNEGMETLRSPRSVPHFRGLDSAIEAAGFSGPRRPEHSREVIGRSELLAKKH